MASYDGKGCFGKVYKEIRQGRWAAVKKVPWNLMTREDVDREYKVYKAAVHPNIVKLLERPILHFDMRWNIPMEYIFGEDLETIIFHPRKSNIESTPTIKSKIITGMCEGLFHLHSKDIVHQDLKPDNIMVESNTHRAVIIDMGLAKFYRNGLNSAQNRGNEAYAAPEITSQPEAQRDHRSDVWAMGKIIAELLIGFRIPSIYINPAYIQETLQGNVYCNPVSLMLDGSPIPRATMAGVISEIRAAGRVSADRGSLSTPSYSLGHFPVPVPQQAQHGALRRFDNFPMLPPLPPNFRLPDSLPNNCRVTIGNANYDQRSFTHVQAQFRGGRLSNAWWMKVKDDDQEEDGFGLNMLRANRPWY